jgi:branched-chain amino acid transport system substrate-binding protein
MKNTLGFLLCLALCASAARGADAAGQAPYEINAVLSLTGSSSESGSEEAESLRAAEGYINKAGGIKGRPVKVLIADDGSSPQVAVQLLNGLIARKAPVVLGSTTTGTCSAMMPLVQAGGPVMYCFAPGLNPPPEGYAFTSSVSARDLVTMVMNYVRARHWTKIALLMTTDATGQELDRQFTDVMALPENKNVSVVAHEHFGATDISTTAQAARIKSLNPQMLVIWSIGSPFGTALRSVHDVGLNIPIMASAGDMTYAQMTQYAPFLSDETFFPATAAAIPQGLANGGPVRDAQDAFFTTLKAAGIHASFPHNLAWDPVMKIVAALRALGPNANATQIRDYILHMHGFVGIDGIYDFSDGKQRGVGLNAARMYRYDSKKRDFILVARGNGLP